MTSDSPYECMGFLLNMSDTELENPARQRTKHDDLVKFQNYINNPFISANQSTNLPFLFYFTVCCGCLCEVSVTCLTTVRLAHSYFAICLRMLFQSLC